MNEATLFPMDCPVCDRLLVIVLASGEPEVLRFCPMCGERSLYWNDEALTLLQDE